MNNRERFDAIFSYKKYDRMPIYYFGTWPETKVKWAQDNMDYDGPTRGHAGPQIKGMDLDWESGMWGSQGLFRVGPVSDLYCILEETDDYTIKRTSDGSIEKELKKSTSINQTLEHALKPTRESWENFKKVLNPKDKRRFPDNLDEKINELKNKDVVRFFNGGSLYGWIRNWMGVEEISYFMFDDPELLEEMVSYITDFLIEVSKDALSKVEMDVAYIWEDCCGASGPLFSPSIYDEIFDKYYRKLFTFYKSMGVKYIMLDSDGYCDPLIPNWLKSGVDILFPLEVGTWEHSPEKVRSKFGRDVKIFGGVNKHFIPQGKDAIRKHLLELKHCVDEGGYIPIPDHRIPPDCPLESVYEYIEVFNEVFNGGKIVIRMVLDTDTYNEVDDQFALIYALLSPEAVKVEAIYAAPFFNEMSKGPADGMEKSYDEIIRLLDVLDFKKDNFVFKGSDRYMGSLNTPCVNDAVNHLIDLAMKSSKEDPLYVVAIGAPTNVSSAITIKPEIIDKIRVVWLGGHSRSYVTASEFNLKQDIVASKVLFDSKVDLVQIPCRPVASHLLVSVPELKASMGESEIAKALTALVDEALEGDPGKTRVIWDISAVAYLVNRKYVRTNKIHSPILNDNLCYSVDERRHFIECAYHLDRDGIFGDFLQKNEITKIVNEVKNEFKRISKKSNSR